MITSLRIAALRDPIVMTRIAIAIRPGIVVQLELVAGTCHKGADPRGAEVNHKIIASGGEEVGCEQDVQQPRVSGVVINVPLATRSLLPSIQSCGTNNDVT